MSAPVVTAPLPTFGTGSLLKGTVKQILSGDTVIVRGVPKGGPPPERTVGLSGITAPRIARRPNDPNAEITEKDEPFAWETREFMRKKLVGKEVCFVLDPKTLGNKKEYGLIYLGKDTTGENIAESLVNEGLVEVRKTGIRMDDQQTKLMQLEEVAMVAKKGKWGDDAAEHVREVKWVVENPRAFVDSCKNKEIDAVIEHVRDGCTIRAFLLPSFQYVTIMFTGIRTPMFKMEEGKSVAEPLADEVKYFTEVRLLQRDVKVVIEGASNLNLLGTVKHPMGSISELLLSEGFAHCTDWSMKNVTQGIEKMRAAEKRAKEKKVRIWKDYVAPLPAVEIKEKKLTGKVVEVVNGDALIVKLANNSLQKIFLSSVRPPRLQDSGGDGGEKKGDPRVRPRPLYDTPYMFEAREFLRKKLIGKKVNIEVDYIQAKSADFAEKMCCTVLFGGNNMGEALVSRGLATVIRYRQNDDQRSCYYDDMMQAEEKAKDKAVGLHSRKEPPVVRVADLAGDLQKAKHFLSFLTRAGMCEALVEFVASGSRFRLYIPKETCLITFLLAGIQCPRGSRPMPSNANGLQMTPADPYGDEAFTFVKELIMQREVTVEVEGMDKGGNFIGWCFVEGLNLSLALVEEGLAKVHFTAERSSHYKALQEVEGKAKAKNLNLWSLEPEQKTETEEVVVVTERKVSYKKVVVTVITPELHFYAQNVESGPSLEKLMGRLRAEFTQAPPLPASYTPKKGDLCAAKFEDGEWYRAQVEKVLTNHKAAVLYVDFGNRETIEFVRLATLPASYHQLSPQAHLYALACVALPNDPDDILTAIRTFSDEVSGRQFLLNVEYKTTGLEHASLLDADKEMDVAQYIIRDGLLLGERRREKYLQVLVEKYLVAEEAAKKERLNLWKYGDFTGDDV